MRAQSSIIPTTNMHFLPLIIAAVLGLAVIIIAGHVQADFLHAAAHDVRHAAGLPCH